ncbi:MAG TPA: hypothetical protein VGM84_07625 [Steroidobacteraceae bacterium]
MARTSRGCWNQVCSALALTDASTEYDRLVKAWGRWNRHYHTLDHLNTCLVELDATRELATDPAEVEVALWFHDAVYRTYRRNNETRSAAWAAEFLERHSATADAANRVRNLVLATRHEPGPLAGDAALVVDIDLSILGQPPDVYHEFERNVRREYAWVPRGHYAKSRTAVLRSFLVRSSVYCWPRFRERYEAAARDNVRRAIAGLMTAN